MYNVGTFANAGASAGIVIPLFSVPLDETVSAAFEINVGTVDAPSVAHPLVALAVIAM